jgi:hypothetical protein
MVSRAQLSEELLSDRLSRIGRGSSIIPHSWETTWWAGKIDKCTTRDGRRWCAVHKGSSEQDSINAVVVEMTVTAG